MKKLLKVLGIIVLVLVVGVVAYHFLRPNHFMTKEEAVQQMWTLQSKFVQWNGLDIHIMEQGAGPALLLIHGLGGNAREYDEIVPLLDKDFRVIRFDLPGFGISDVPKFEEEDPDLLQFYSNFMTFMLGYANSDTIYIVGNSLGGMIGWETAAQHPDKVDKLVLLASAGYDMKKIADDATKWLKNPVVRFMIAKGLSEDIAKKNLTFCTFHDYNIDPEHFKHKYICSNKEGNLDWMIRLSTNQQFPDTQDIQTIQAPTLIIWGADDPLIPYDHASRFQHDIPNSTLLTYPECGHIPMMEYPQQTADDIKAFLMGE